MAEGYGAVFIAAGAQASMRIGIIGETDEPEGLYYGLKFLIDVRTGKERRLKGRVVVIGGGNVAVDTARTALRVGAKNVQIFYRRSREEMPSLEKDVEEAVEEGIVLNFYWAPKQILHQDGKVTGIEFVRSKTVIGEDGRTHLSLDSESTQVVDCETVIISIGQAPDISFLSKDSQLERSLWGSLEVEENNLATNISGIFAGGDFITGPSTVIEAIASGRRASVAIDKHLQGDKDRVRIVDEKTSTPEDTGLALDEETAEEIPRIRIELEKVEERVSDFREVEKGFSSQEALHEAKRCLRCDLERERMSK